MFEVSSKATAHPAEPFQPPQKEAEESKGPEKAQEPSEEEKECEKEEEKVIDKVQTVIVKKK